MLACLYLLSTFPRSANGLTVCLQVHAYLPSAFEYFQRYLYLIERLIDSVTDVERLTHCLTQVPTLVVSN